MAIEFVGQAVEDRNSGRPQDALLSNMELPLRGTFYPLGFAVEIITNNSDVLRVAKESFSHWQLRRAGTPLQIRIGISDDVGNEYPPEPTRRAFNHLYSLVANAENQALLDLNTCSSFVWVTKLALQSPLYFRYNFLEKVVYLLLGASVVTDLHAACVSKNGKGILLCGDSGAGKSTLAYACARVGWTYTSDDTSYLINGSIIPRVIGHSHRVRFRPAAKSLFPELVDRELTPRMEGKASIEVPICELPPVTTTSEANVDAVVYLNRHSSAPVGLVRLSEGTATERTRKELYSTGDIRAKHESILKILSNIPTFDLHYYELHEAIHQLELLVRRD